MILQIIIYLFFYIIGVTLGSFFTLAIYRIPLKEDITHTRSYCPNCNHKLQFLDLIPILSYVFLKCKCRYCHNKISKRYIIIETLSGFIYLLFVMSLKIDFFSITINNIINLLFGSLIISTLFILGGIAKETKKFQKNVFIFSIVLQIIYLICLFILKINIYTYILYLVLIELIVLFITCIIILCNKFFKKNNNFLFYFCFLNILVSIILNFIIL